VSWSPVGAGTRATGGGTLTSTLNGSTVSGNLILLFMREKSVALATPGSGYTSLFSPYTYMQIWGKFAGGSEPNPTLSATNAYFESATFSWSGGANPSIGGIVGSSSSQIASPQINIPLPALTITSADSLVVGFGYTLGAASGTISNPSALPNTIDSVIGINSGCGAVCDYVVQTTATNIASSVWIPSAGTSVTVTGLILSLLPGSASGAGENGAQMLTGMGS